MFQFIRRQGKSFTCEAREPFILDSLELAVLGLLGRELSQGQERYEDNHPGVYGGGSTLIWPSKPSGGVTVTILFVPSTERPSKPPHGSVIGVGDGPGVGLGIGIGV